MLMGRLECILSLTINPNYCFARMHQNIDKATTNTYTIDSEMLDTLQFYGYMQQVFIWYCKQTNKPTRDIVHILKQPQEKKGIYKAIFRFSQRKKNLLLRL